MNFDSLPIRIVITIAQHLDGHSVSYLSATCRRLRYLKNEPQVWK